MAETISIDRLKRDESNRNKGSTRGRRAVRDSIERFGAARSVVLDKHGNVIAGNSALAAALELGLDDVIVIETTGEHLVAVKRTDLDLTEKRGKARALSISDNVTGALGYHLDLSAIADDFKAGLDLPDSILSSSEISEMLARQAAAAEALGDEMERGEGFGGVPSGLVEGVDPDEIPEEVETRCKAGDLWRLGEHRLLCGDSIVPENVARLLDGAKLDILLTDPPYCSGGFQEAGKKSGSIGTRGKEMIINDILSSRGYQALMQTILCQWHAGIAYIFTDWRMWVNLFDVVERTGYGCRNMLVWDKMSPGMGVGWRHQHELVMVGVKVTHHFDPKKAQGNVLQSKRTGNPLHPTQKPVDLLTAILGVTSEAQHVGDPFGGSGTTLMACEVAGRRAFVCEVAPVFCDRTLARWERATNQTARRLD